MPTQELQPVKVEKFDAPTVKPGWTVLWYPHADPKVDGMPALVTVVGNRGAVTLRTIEGRRLTGVRHMHDPCHKKLPEMTIESGGWDFVDYSGYPGLFSTLLGRTVDAVAERVLSAAPPLPPTIAPIDPEDQQPTAEDIERILNYAAEGLRAHEIRLKMGRQWRVADVNDVLDKHRQPANA